MNELQKKLAAAIAASALLVNTAFPVLATTIEITGNGSDTYNEADVEVENSTYVQQDNEAYIENNVNVTADTGHNDANRNTGGDVTVSTGAAGALVGVSNQANTNVAEVDGCCEADADVLISENGDGSRNTVDLDVNEDGERSGTYVGQFNDADVLNNVDANAKTGYNDAERNTGGDVTVETGDAFVGVTLASTANINSAKVGGGDGGATVSARILGNGSDTRNLIDLEYERNLLVMQDNEARIENNVNAFAKTGGNDANRNTGGNVTVDTGNAGVDVSVDNMANFNWADVDCGCLLDVWAKIAGNGDESWNKILADVDSGFSVQQTNLAVSGGLFNNIDVYAKTGYNDAERNTGDVDGGDPSIYTGDSSVVVDVENSANTNVLNDSSWEWPEMPELPDWISDGEWHFGFEWAALWAYLHGSFSG